MGHVPNLGDAEHWSPIDRTPREADLRDRFEMDLLGYLGTANRRGEARSPLPRGRHEWNQVLGGWRPGKATGPTRRPAGSAPPERRYDEYRGVVPPELSGAAERRKRMEDLVREQMALEGLELGAADRGDFVELIDVDPLSYLSGR